MSSEKLFVTFDESLIKKIHISSSRHYYYLSNGIKHNLEEKKIDELSNTPLFSIYDEYRKWNEIKNSQSLFVDLTFSLSNLVHIFHGDDRVCFSNAVLGIGLEWKPKNSKIKKCIKLGDINDYLEGDCACFTLNNIEIEFPDNDIDFYWFIYIVKPGFGDSGQKRFGNSKGLILGKELLWSLKSSGNASMFPIDEIYELDAPLWKVRCSFSDWCVDEFNQDNLSIIMNKAHPLFPCIQYGEPDFNELLFKEVISSAFSTLIEQIVLIAKEDDSYLDLEKDGIEEEGSILAAVKYFKSAKLIKVNGLPSELFESVKIMFDKEKGFK